MLNDNQNVAYYTITRQVPERRYFFIEAPGGTGKISLTKLILAKHRKECSIVLAVASSLIASKGWGTWKCSGCIQSSTWAVYKWKPSLLYYQNLSDDRSYKTMSFDKCTVVLKRPLEVTDRMVRIVRNNQSLISGIFRQILKKEEKLMRFMHVWNPPDFSNMSKPWNRKQIWQLFCLIIQCLKNFQKESL